MSKKKRGGLSADDFVLDSGGGLPSGFWGEVIKAKFGYDSKYSEQAGEDIPGLIIWIDREDKGEDDEDKEMRQFYSLGKAKGWEVDDDEESVESSENPDDNSFHENSRAGEVVKKIMSIIGVKAVTNRGFYMTEADFYLELGSLYWEQVPMDVVGEKGKKKSVLLPTKGKKGKGKKDEDEEPKKEKKKKSFEVEEDDLEKIKELASGKSKSELRKAIRKDDDLKRNSELMNYLYEEDGFKELEKAGELVFEDGEYA